MLTSSATSAAPPKPASGDRAFRHPQLRFYLRGIEKLRFVMDMGVPETTFKETGPIVLTIFVNEHPLDKIRIDQPGDRHIEKPVPPAFLHAGSENFVSFETDKQWVSKEDGAVLSFRADPRRICEVMVAALYVLFGAAFTVASCIAAGRLVLRCCGCPWIGPKHGCSSFLLGWVVVSNVVFLLCAVRLVHKGVLLAAGAGAIWVAAWSFVPPYRDRKGAFCPY